MGKLFESLRRSGERPHMRLAEPDLRVASGEDEAEGIALMPLPLGAPAVAWPSLAEDQTVPAYETPNGRTPRTGEAPSAALRGPQAERRSGIDWRPLAAPALDENWTKIAEELLLELRARDAGSLLLLPVEDTAGMAELTMGLSAALAIQLRQPMLLIDTLRGEESAAAGLSLAAAPGWEELLLGLDPAHAVQRSEVVGLDVIAAGNRLAHATPARWAKEAGRKLRSLAERYRLLLVASQPWPQSPLGLVLAAETHAACLAVPAGLVDGPAHERLLREMQAEGRCVLGSLSMG